MKNFKLLSLIALLFLGFAASSCLEIEEEYYFRKDGSGTGTVRMDLTKMMEMYDMLKGMGGAEQMEGMGEMEEMFEDESLTSALARIPGVSNVKSLNDKETFMYGYTYEFSDIKTLNEVLNMGTDDGGLSSLMNGMGGDTEDVEMEKKVTMKGKKFSFAHSADQLYKLVQENEDLNQNMGMVSMMMADASYSLKLSFDKPVKKVKKGSGESADGGKTLVIKESLEGLMSGDAKLSCKLKLK